MLVGAEDAEATPAKKCDRFASTHGSDAASGTRAHPVRTAARIIGALRPGQTACFRRGRYSFNGITLREPRVTLTPLRGQRVTLKGTINIGPTARGATLKDLRLDGSGGTTGTGPKIYANRAMLLGNEITNGNSATCVQISASYPEASPRDVVIARNRIHHCGALRDTHHGIYVAAARNAVIRDNWIYENAGLGIQQYPSAQDSRITRNVIDSNGDGINVGGDGFGSCSNGNVVTGNVIANATLGWNAYSGGDGPDCSGNVVSRNCVYARRAVSPYNAHGGIETPSRSFSASNNRIARPRYVDGSAGDFRLRPSSRCTPIIKSRARPRTHKEDPRLSLLACLVELERILSQSLT